MAFKDRWMNAIKRGQEAGYKAARKVGFDIGYATTTIKDEVAYAMGKVANTRVVQAFTDGYKDGRDEAEYAFAQRCERREEKARTKYEAKAAREAADELFDEFENEDFDF